MADKKTRKKKTPLDASKPKSDIERLASDIGAVTSAVGFIVVDGVRQVLLPAQHARDQLEAQVVIDGAIAGERARERARVQSQWADIEAQLRAEPDLAERASSLFSEWERALATHEDGRELNVQCALIVNVDGYWAAKVKEPAFVDAFRNRIVVQLAQLDQVERIRTLSTLLARIATLQSSGQTILTPIVIDGLTSTIIEAFAASGFGEQARDLDTLKGAMVTNADTWKPPELWRERYPDETAAAYFKRIVAPIPFALRPTTTQLAAVDKPLYDNLNAVCAYNKKSGREGGEEIEKATRISQLLPVGVPKRRTLGADQIEIADGGMENAPWFPAETWSKERETVAQFYNRTFATVLKDRRPNTTQLLEWDANFHKNIASMANAQKRFGRTGEGEAGKAHHLSDLFKIGAPRGRGIRDPK